MHVLSAAKSLLHRIGTHRPGNLIWLWAPVCAFIAACFLIVPYGAGAVSLLLHGPDNYLRLAEIRDWLNGQSWWDVTQYRIDPPTGVHMHWSRLADLPVAGLIVLLRPFVGPERAEIWAVAAAPPLLLFSTLALLARAANSLGGKTAGDVAPFVAVTVAMLLAQYLPGRIDHHGLQLMCLAGGLAAALSAESRRNGAWLAIAASYSMVVGLETAPMFALIAAWLVVRWVWQGEPAREKLLGFVVGIGVALPLLYCVSTAPKFWLQATGDQIGRGHIAIVWTATALLFYMLRKPAANPAKRALQAGLVAAAALAVLSIFPEVLQPPYAKVDALTKQVWLSHVAETASLPEIWKADPRDLLGTFTFPVLALAVSVRLAARGDAAARYWLLSLLTAGGIVLSAWEIRATAMTSLPAIVIVACALVRASRYWREHGHALPFVLAIFLLNGFAGPEILVLLKEAKENRPLATRAELLPCERQIAQARLDRFAPGLVLTSSSLGEVVLIHSHHAILASSTHRDYRGNSLAFRILLAPPAKALELLRKRKVDYILDCPNFEFSYLAKMADGGLAAALKRGNPPDWLQPLYRPQDGAFTFYRIAPPSTGVTQTPRNDSPSTSQRAT